MDFLDGDNFIVVMMMMMVVVVVVVLMMLSFLDALAGANIFFPTAAAAVGGSLGVMGATVNVGLGRRRRLFRRLILVIVHSRVSRWYRRHVIR